ncbi:MAG: endonuclease/exonuclease/phosphatase family protein [Prevotella sp.]|nr:endonuclease/exonuclease/phosphatase family protein [Prevotella sp.]
MTKNTFRKLVLALVLHLCGAVMGGEMPAQTFKVLSYNIYKGLMCDSSVNKQDFAKWVSKQQPDIVALQEVNGFTQAKLSQLAADYGHPYAVLLKEEGYPVALTSRFPIVNVQKVIDNMHHGFILAQVKNYHILVTHLSPHKYKKRGEEVDMLLATVKATHPKGKWLMMGDFNAYSPWDKESYKDGLVRERTRQLEMKYKSHQNLKNGELDFSVIEKVLNGGFCDALKLKNRDYVSSAPTKVLEHSDLHANPTFRIDYIFVSQSLKKDVVQCRIIKDDYTDNHSDHYPVWLELSPDK